MNYIAELGDKADDLWEKLSKEEKEVYDIVFDACLEMGTEYLMNHSAKELNEHFGGSGDKTFTEGVRQAMLAFCACDDFMDELMEVYDDLPETDEE